MRQKLRLLLSKKIHGVAVGNTASVYESSGFELVRIRDFKLSDDPHRIDLKSLALTDELKVWEKHPNRGANLYITVDISASGQFGPRGISKKAFMADFCRELARACISEFCRVSLLFHSDKVEYSESLTSSPASIDNACSFISKETKSKKTDLNPVLNYLYNQTGASKTERPDFVFLISDFMADDFEKKLRSLAQEVDCVALAVQDPLDISFPSLGGTMFCKDPETGETFYSSGESGFYDGLAALFKKNAVSSVFLDTSLSISQNLELVANTLENSGRR